MTDEIFELEETQRGKTNPTTFVFLTVQVNQNDKGSHTKLVSQEDKVTHRTQAKPKLGETIWKKP